MTTVLDAGAVTALAASRALVNALRKSGNWPPLVPTVVLTESLTGDHRRDFHVNRLLRACALRPATELIARRAAALRCAARRGGVSAVDAIVAATADHAGGGRVWTSDPNDLQALVDHAINPVTVVPV